MCEGVEYMWDQTDNELTDPESYDQVGKWNPDDKFIEFENDTGETVQWSLEGASPTELIADGWSRDDVKVGDRINVRCHQLKDRSNGCLLGFLTPEGGKEKEWD